MAVVVSSHANRETPIGGTASDSKSDTSLSLPSMIDAGGLDHPSPGVNSKLVKYWALAALCDPEIST